MKLGDLISFKPIGFGNGEWSNPAILIEEYANPYSGLWVVFVEGDRFVIDDENYEIMHLTGS